jgi:hypothetical protein
MVNSARAAALRASLGMRVYARCPFTVFTPFDSHRRPLPPDAVHCNHLFNMGVGTGKRYKQDYLERRRRGPSPGPARRRRSGLPETIG